MDNKQLKPFQDHDLPAKIIGDVFIYNGLYMDDAPVLSSIACNNLLDDAHILKKYVMPLEIILLSYYCLLRWCDGVNLVFFFFFFKEWLIQKLIDTATLIRWDSDKIKVWFLILFIFIF